MKFVKFVYYDEVAKEYAGDVIHVNCDSIGWLKRARNTRVPCSMLYTTTGCLIGTVLNTPNVLRAYINESLS